jgi:hypothetical protein
MEVKEVCGLVTWLSIHSLLCCVFIALDLVVVSTAVDILCSLCCGHV